MNDIHDLNDAFAELERRADTVPNQADAATTLSAPHRRHLTLMAGTSAVAVLAIATVVALTTARDASRLASGQAPGQADGARPSALTALTPTVPPAPTPTAVSTSTPSRPIPNTAKELEHLFTKVLDGAATFTVTDTGAAIVGAAPTATAPPTPSTPSAVRTLAVPPQVETSAVPTTPSVDTTLPVLPHTSGAAIVGLLTSRGVTGGYDIQIFQDTPGTKAHCDDPGQSSCTVHALANGSWLATGSEPLQDGGVTYQAELVQPDGTTIAMHVSNDLDPKGAGGHSAAHPPLTIKQMSTVVTSKLW